MSNIWILQQKEIDDLNERLEFFKNRTLELEVKLLELKHRLKELLKGN